MNYHCIIVDSFFEALNSNSINTNFSFTSLDSVFIFYIIKVEIAEVNVFSINFKNSPWNFSVWLIQTCFSQTARMDVIIQLGPLTFCLAGFSNQTRPILLLYLQRESSAEKYKTVQSYLVLL